MVHSRLFALFLTTTAAALMAAERPAEACGGCFVPPENATVVTDHRMILAVDTGKTTLYDQIRYRGLPEQFAWVLPIAGEVDVGLSADTLFSVLGGLTQTQVTAPPRNCPSPSDCTRKLSASGGRESFGSSDNSPSPAPKSPEVTVTREETVGPYATVQLQSENAEALNQWLADNGFAIPGDVKPIIAAYVKEHFNFLAMKLRPGASVQSMRPVRVTTRGPATVLPLRMVAAGTGAVVGITLWTVGQGRYEPTNFPLFSIRQEELSWDWLTSTSDFKDLRDQRAAPLGGRGWELESSLGLSIPRVRQAVQFTGRQTGGTASTSDYAEVPPVDGKPGKTVDQVREEDLDTIFGKGTGEIRVTRFRSDVAHSALTEDLVLAASADQSVFSNLRAVKKEKNEPLCPVYDGCNVVGNAPRSEAERRMGKSADLGGGSCSTSSASATSAGLFAAGLGILALSALRRNRRPSSR